ncbi:MAG TPA: hypothetical protein VHC39_06795 [Rhizomicrobium sp.]|nr:hypothetical protein [Rhizomicrobium sp.]
MTLASNHLARCVCGQVAISAAGDPGYPPRMMMRLIAARIAMLVSPGKTKR